MYNAPVPPPSELPTPKALLRSTMFAVAAATVLLVTIVLPAEYGVDPTGIGDLLSLTRMGEIKVALAREAEADAAADAAAAAAAESAAGNLSAAPAPEGGSPLTAAAAVPASSAALAPGAKTETVEVLLDPGQGREFKLVMSQGAQVRYDWATDWGVVNFDLHADGTNAARGSTTSYSRGTGRAADEGVLTAAFDGLHGWFWRNRGTELVTVTLRVEGEYRELREIR